MDKETKVEHVKNAKQTREHDCHWPGCGIQVPPAKWGCSKHWFCLPEILRSRIWKAYKIKQEDRLDPSKEYIQAANQVQAWIKSYSLHREAGGNHRMATIAALEDIGIKGP